MVIKKVHMEDMELPNLPGSNMQKNDMNIISPDQFTRKKLRGILHLITGELKNRATKTPHIFLPFRSRIDDNKLEMFISKIFPRGELINMFDEIEVSELLKRFDEFTLICGLKYLWSRLPNNEIIGWDVYLEYKRREKEAGYPKNAFLSIMPKCLSSPAHASIVYDFLDLLIAIASSSQFNYLSGRKIAKMSSIWAFNGSSKPRQSPFYDATLQKENTFIDGLDFWKPTSEALFHLLLSFLRAMLPEHEMDTLKLPKTLQSLLITNSYPPQENTDSTKSIITIPCVVIKSTKASSNVYELLSKVRNTISFNKKDSFLSMENYTILKNIFSKPSTSEIVSSLTEESRRILTRLAADPVQSNYGLIPGWAESEVETDPNIPLFSQINIQDVSLQDYYIWTWLSSIASDQTSHNKKLFGRSMVIEASLKGFQKWLIITEQLLDSEEYLSHFKIDSLGIPQRSSKRQISKEDHKDLPLPPQPQLPPKNNPELLPNYNFNNDDLKMDMYDEDDEYIYPSNVNEEELGDYRRYLDSLGDFDEQNLTKEFDEKTDLNGIDRNLDSKPLPHPIESKPPYFAAKQEIGEQRRKPPQVEPSYQQVQRFEPESYDQPQLQSRPQEFQPEEPTYHEPLYQQIDENQSNQRSNEYQQSNEYQEGLQVSRDRLTPTLDKANTTVKSPHNTRRLAGSSAISSGVSQYLTPNEFDSPRKSPEIGRPYNSPEYKFTSQFKEPFDNYETEIEKRNRLKNYKSEEPYDDYYVAGITSGKNDMEELSSNLGDKNLPVAQGQTLDDRQSPVIKPLPVPEHNNSPIPLQSQSPEHIHSQDIIAEYGDENQQVKEEKKKKKKSKKKKEQTNAQFGPEIPTMPPFPPYGALPPGQSPPGMMMPFFDPNASLENLPPSFFPPGPPPGMETSPKKSKERRNPNKTKEKIKKKKNVDSQGNQIDTRDINPETSSKRIENNEVASYETISHNNAALQSHPPQSSTKIDANQNIQDNIPSVKISPESASNDRTSPQHHYSQAHTPQAHTPQHNSSQAHTPQHNSSQHSLPQHQHILSHTSPQRQHNSPQHQNHSPQYQHQNYVHQHQHQNYSPQHQHQNYSPQQISPASSQYNPSDHQQQHNLAREQRPQRHSPVSAPHYPQISQYNKLQDPHPASQSVPHLITSHAPPSGSHSSPHLPLPPSNHRYGQQPSHSRKEQPISPPPSSHQYYSGPSPAQQSPYEAQYNQYPTPPVPQQYVTKPNGDGNYYQYGNNMPPQHNYPPPQQYFPQQMNGLPSMANGRHSKPALPMTNVPSGATYKKNAKSNKKDLRAAFNQGTFGI